MEGETSSTEEEENVRKLRAYLERNWEYLAQCRYEVGWKTA